MNSQTLSSFRETARNKLGNDVFNQLDHEAELIAENIITLQTQLADAVKKYMNDTGKGFNEIQNDLEISSNKLNSILKGTGNFTIKSISEIFGLLGKKVTLNFQ
ncbi:MULTISPECIES: hypothetical protein [Cysteiniphilum]|uniref:hypothetical protein n=1 Tax=Cysteiniphilum TaxID=2056696 RepID=UPI001787504F|nr:MULTISPECIES: hypothetical protein [Cysteiniphilum]